MGNPAAVFCDAKGLSDKQMQAIAKQLNLVETIFVFPSDQADFSFRYFTPEKELPVAGHPTIAACIALVHAKKINLSYQRMIRIHTGDGFREMVIEDKNDDLYVKMKQTQPRIGSFIKNRGEVAQILGIQEQDLLSDYPILSVNTGLKQLIVPIRSLSRLMAIKRDIVALKRLCDELQVDEVQAFTFETYQDAASIHTRNICPREGIEDPACGMGNAALGAYLSNQNVYKDGFSIIAEQGNIVDMACEVEIEVSVDKEIWIGGMGKLVMQGEYFV